MSAKPNALILGGSGFVGRHLSRQLADRYVVTATGRGHDIRDPETVRLLVGAVRPSIVVDLAAITTVRETFEEPRRTYDISFGGLLNLFEALEAHRFEGRLLYVSSSEVFGFPAPADLPLTEASQFRPMSPYAVAKLACEGLCHQWSHNSKFDIDIARPFTHIGPGQSARFAVAKFAEQVAKIAQGRRKPVIDVGNLHATRDLTDVRDVVRAYDLCLHRALNGGVLNVCSGTEIVMRDVLSMLIELSGESIEVREDKTAVRATEQQRLFGSYAALENATGWTPQIPLAKTLTDMLAFALNPPTKTS